MKDSSQPASSSGVLSIYDEAYAKRYPSLYVAPWEAKHRLNALNIATILDGGGCARESCWLDIACGQAWHFSNVHSEIRKVGLDISTAQLEAARRVNPEAAFVCGDMSGSVFRPATFDLVTSFWAAYCYLDDVGRIRSFLDHAIDSVRPDGAAYFEVLLSQDLAAFNNSRFARHTGFDVIPRCPDYSRWSYRDSGGEHLMTSPPLSLFFDRLSQSFTRVAAEHDAAFMVHVIATGKREG